MTLYGTHDTQTLLDLRTAFRDAVATTRAGTPARRVVASLLESVNEEILYRDLAEAGVEDFYNIF